MPASPQMPKVPAPSTWRPTVRRAWRFARRSRPSAPRLAAAPRAAGAAVGATDGGSLGAPPRKSSDACCAGVGAPQRRQHHAKWSTTASGVWGGGVARAARRARRMVRQEGKRGALLGRGATEREASVYLQVASGEGATATGDGGAEAADIPPPRAHTEGGEGGPAMASGDEGSLDGARREQSRDEQATVVWRLLVDESRSMGGSLLLLLLSPQGLREGGPGTRPWRRRWRRRRRRWRRRWRLPLWRTGTRDRGWVGRRVGRRSAGRAR